MRKQLLISVLLSGSIWSCAGPSIKDSPNSIPLLEIDTNKFQVGILIMDGVYNTELTAPYDVFHHTKFRSNIKAMQVSTIANKRTAITTFEGMRIIPDFDYLLDSLPQIDILVIPSAENHLGSDLGDNLMLAFVRKMADQATFITSHCDGSFVLAAAGLLNQKVSTTFPGDVSEMRTMFPHLDIRENVVLVHDGKYITSAGGARSFEASLYLCELLYGSDVAQEIAEGMVIDWDLDKLIYIRIESQSNAIDSTL